MAVAGDLARWVGVSFWPRLWRPIRKIRKTGESEGGASFSPPFAINGNGRPI